MPLIAILSYAAAAFIYFRAFTFQFIFGDIFLHYRICRWHFAIDFRFLRFLFIFISLTIIFTLMPRFRQPFSSIFSLSSYFISASFLRFIHFRLSSFHALLFSHFSCISSYFFIIFRICHWSPRELSISMIFFIFHSSFFRFDILSSCHFSSGIGFQAADAAFHITTPFPDSFFFHLFTPFIAFDIISFSRFIIFIDMSSHSFFHEFRLLFFASYWCHCRICRLFFIISLILFRNIFRLFSPFISQLSAISATHTMRLSVFIVSFHTFF